MWVLKLFTEAGFSTNHRHIVNYSLNAAPVCTDGRRPIHKNIYVRMPHNMNGNIAKFRGRKILRTKSFVLYLREQK